MLEPEVETRSWDEQLALDDASYRAQLGYLFERSAFYRRKLGAAGIAAARDAGGLADIAGLPLTEKSELKATTTEDEPIGAHLCATPAEFVRVYSTSGTTGTPSYIPLTRRDLDDWVTGSARSYAASGLVAGQRIVSTYNAGPFVAGAALASFDRIGLCHIPIGTGNTDRLLVAIRLLRPDAAVLTPSYAANVVEVAAEQGLDLRASSVERVPSPASSGGGEPAFARGSRRVGPVSPRPWASATSGSRSGASVKSRTGCTSARAGSCSRADRSGIGESRSDRRRVRRAGAHASPAPGRSARPLPYARSRRDTHERLLLRTDGAARPLSRAYGRHAHRARRERLSDGDPRRRGGVLAEGQRAVSSGRARPASSRSRHFRWPSSSPTGSGGPGLRRGDPCETARGARRPDACGACSVGQPGAERVQVGARGSVTSPMRKIQTQGVIHITINGANRQTAIDFWEGVLGMPFVSSSRTSTTRRRATSTSTRATDG